MKKMVQEGDISQGHARALLPLGDEQEQIEFAQKIKKEGMSVRATEQGVHDRIHALDGDQLRIVDAEGNSRPVTRPRNEQIASLEQELRTSLGTKVDLSQTAKGHGKITIHFQEPRRVRAAAADAGETGGDGDSAAHRVAHWGLAFGSTPATRWLFTRVLRIAVCSVFTLFRRCRFGRMRLGYTFNMNR